MSYGSNVPVSQHPHPFCALSTNSHTVRAPFALQGGSNECSNATREDLQNCGSKRSERRVAKRTALGLEALDEAKSGLLQSARRRAVKFFKPLQHRSVCKNLVYTQPTSHQPMLLVCACVGLKRTLGESVYAAATFTKSPQRRGQRLHRISRSNPAVPRRCGPKQALDDSDMWRNKSKQRTRIVKFNTGGYCAGTLTHCALQT